MDETRSAATAGPTLTRLEDAVREVRRATRDEAAILESALTLATPASFASVHVAHLDLVDAVHRMTMTMELLRQTAANPSRLPSALRMPAGTPRADRSTPLVDPFAIARR